MHQNKKKSARRGKLRSGISERVTTRGRRHDGQGRIIRINQFTAARQRRISLRSRMPDYRGLIYGP